MDNNTHKTINGGVPQQPSVIEKERDENLERLNNAVKSLEEQKMMTRIALEGSKGYTWESDWDKTYLKLGDTYQTVTGIDPMKYGGDFFSFFEGVDSEALTKSKKQYMDYCNKKSDAFSSIFSQNDSEGERRWYLSRGKFTDDSCKTMVGVTFDITEQRKREEQIIYMAFKDTLTGLYNFQYLASDLCLEMTESFDGMGLILTDIAGFSKVNEFFGYEFGNLVLLDIVSMFANVFEDAIVARVSGDKFLVLINADSEDEVKEYGDRLIDTFSEPLAIENQLVNIAMKIGICYSPKTEGKSVIDLFKDAEIALHYAKMGLAGNICVSNDKLRSELNDKHLMEFDMQRALANNEFVLYFQPNIDVRTKRVIGCEALIRWMHPTHGLIPPLKFIPLAEETGLIIPIGDFVIDEAARNLKIWRDEGYDIYVSVNVSARQFSTADFENKLRAVIDKYQIPSSSMIIEITESLMITDFARISSLLDNLRKGGIKVSLDDFGTGYSSMNYLVKMPIDNLKIDKAFLDNVLSGVNDRAILETIITLARKLGLNVTAEGVENPEQVNLLEHCGCDTLQGYLFSKPLPAAQFTEFLHVNEGKTPF